MIVARTDAETVTVSLPPPASMARAPSPATEQVTRSDCGRLQPGPGLGGVLESTTVTVVPDTLTAKALGAPVPSLTDTTGPLAETVAAEASAVAAALASRATARPRVAARNRP